jgi:hypothetical protein
MLDLAFSSTHAARLLPEEARKRQVAADSSGVTRSHHRIGLDPLNGNHYKRLAFRRSPFCGQDVSSHPPDFSLSSLALARTSAASLNVSHGNANSICRGGPRGVPRASNSLTGSPRLRRSSRTVRLMAAAPVAIATTQNVPAQCTLVSRMLSQRLRQGSPLDRPAPREAPRRPISSRPFALFG